MPANLRAVPQVMPPGAMSSTAPSQLGWVWNGTNWCWDSDCDPCLPPTSPPFPCPPSGFPTPCPPWFPPPAGQAPWYPGANGGVSFSATPPVNPIRGNFWWDGVMLHLFDGAAWVDIGPTAGGASAVGTSPPSNPSIGTTWWNGSIFQVWDGTAWRLTSGSVVSTSAPTGPSVGETWWNGSIFQVWDGTAWKLVGPPSPSPTGGTTVLEFAITQPSSVTVGVDSSHWTAVPLTATPVTDTLNGWNPATLRYTPNKAGYYQFQGRSVNSAATAGLAIVKNDPGTYTSLSSDITVSITTATAAGWLSVAGIAPMNGTTDYVRLWAYNTNGSLIGAGSNTVLGAYMLP